MLEHTGSWRVPGQSSGKPSGRLGSSAGTCAGSTAVTWESGPFPYAVTFSLSAQLAPELLLRQLSQSQAQPVSFPFTLERVQDLLPVFLYVLREPDAQRPWSK